MDNEILRQSIESGLIDATIESQDEFKPKLVLNKKNKSNVLGFIVKELKTCDEFYISVAFINGNALRMLQTTFDDLSSRGIKGKLITADYLQFNKPEVFEKLLKIDCLEVKRSISDGFHAKGYVFRHGDTYTMIIGSSNLTDHALKMNNEWNLCVSSHENGELLNETIQEFNDEWQNAQNITEDWIKEYKRVYNETKRYSISEEKPFFSRLEPNKMQQLALDNLNDLRAHNKHKALLISATGTGKTYLSVFDVKQFNPKRMMFIAHRGRLLEAAMQSYQNVFGDSKSMSIYKGQRKQHDADFVFASIATLSKNDNLKDFNPNEFDYIVIDEVHRAGAPTYEKVIGYFKPLFLLGMSATPERNSGKNVFEIFDYNIAAEIRLQQALEENMLCPFQYYGVSDVTLDGKDITEEYDFNKFTSSQRVDNIMQKAAHYGYSGRQVHGLIFVSRVEEGKSLSNKFNERGWTTTFLSGEDSADKRDEIIDQLEDGLLDYIVSVDILNEGVDIPCVNQIIMLRPTQSAIIFVQQLGRGLRKDEDKDSLVVIDFIGNYQNNYLIPVALSGDQSYKKDRLRNWMINKNIAIPGCTTVDFEKVVEEKIFNSINKAKTNSKTFIENKYNDLKNKLGRIPLHIDFLKYDAIDLQIIFNHYCSYIGLLNKIEPTYQNRFNSTELDFFIFLSKVLGNGTSIKEIELINKLMTNEMLSDDDMIAAVHLQSSYYVKQRADLIGNLNIVKYEKNQLVLSEEFQKCLKHDEFLNTLKDLFNYITQVYNNEYSHQYLDTNLCLYQQYSRFDVQRLMGFEKEVPGINIGGYFFMEEQKKCVVFINYNKKDDLPETQKYNDRFYDKTRICGISKSKCKIGDKDYKKFYNKDNDNYEFHLFVRKSTDEDLFYYLGKVHVVGEARPDTNEKGQNIFELDYKLDTPVEDRIYDYLTSKIIMNND